MVHNGLTTTAAEIEDTLPKLVHIITAPLYEAFALTVLPVHVVQGVLAEMRERR